MSSQLGDGLLQAALIATVVFSPDEADTALGFATTLAIIYVPYSFVGPLVGTLIDRWSRRAILMWTPWLRATCVLPMLFTGRTLPWWAMVPLLLVFSTNRFFLATAAAVVPRLVPTDDLVKANSAATVGGTVAAFTGTALGGGIAAVVGQEALIPVIITLWISAGLLARWIQRSLIAHRPSGERSVREGVVTAGREFADGMRRLSRTPRAAWPIGGVVTAQFVEGYVIVLSLFVLRDLWKGGVGSYSWLLAAGAVGIFTGLATVDKLQRRIDKPRVISLAFLLAGLGLMANALLVVPATAMVCAMLLGLTYAWRRSTSDTMVQEAIPDAYRGRVFSVYDVLFNLARVGAAYAGVVGLPTLGITGSLVVGGMICLLWVPILPWAIHRSPEFVLRLDDAGVQPVAVARGGPEEKVTDIVADSGATDPARTMQLALDDGSVVDVALRDGAWHVQDEI